jgi:uncharacterized protein
MHYVIVPGINGSGRQHWQTHWQQAWGTTASRIEPASWDAPELNDWCRAIDEATAVAGPVILIAHSLGCLAAATWLTRPHRPGRTVHAALLVAPPDPTATTFPAKEAPTFTDLPMAHILTRALVVSSENDPYCTPQAAKKMAEAWNAAHTTIGRAGHINAESGLGTWERGRALLRDFLAGTEML